MKLPECRKNFFQLIFNTMENYDALTFENKIKVDDFVDMFYQQELGMFSLEELMEEEEEAVKVAVKEYLNFF